jgi:hypothetical protein
MMSGNLGTVVKPYRNLNGEMFAVPTTWDIASPDYIIPEMAWDENLEFVTCTLNGRMWVFRFFDENDGYEAYAIMVLAKNVETGRLEVVSQTRLPRVPDGEGYLPEFPVSRGIDWILTCRAIIQVFPDPPYISYRELFWIDFSRSVDPVYRVQFSAYRRYQYYTVSGQEIGPHIDPFTHNRWGTDPPSACDGMGYLYATIGNLSVYPVGARQMEACYSTAADLGGWILLEDFVLPKPEIWNQIPNSEYHHMWHKAKPVIPVDYSWINAYESDTGEKVYEDRAHGTWGTGYSATRRGIQIATFDNKLWARSLMYMGRAYLIPAFKNQHGFPEEFFLFISNSHNCAGPYRIFLDPNISEDTYWMDTGPVGLRDVTGETFAVYAGLQTAKTNPLTAPICQTPLRSEVLIPNAPDGFEGTWVNPRPGDVGMTGYDSFTRAGLFLGERGAVIFGGDSTTGQLTVIDDYTCLNISEWLAPARQLESIHWEIVCSSADRELFITRLTNYFHRELFGERLLPLAWGFEERTDENGVVTEQVRLSFGKEKGLTEEGVPVSVVSVTEMSFPPDFFDPPEPRISAEEVFRDPYTINIFRLESGTALAGQVKASWFRGPGPIANGMNYYYPSPFPSLIYKCTNNEIGIHFIDPDTGALTPWEHTFSNVASNDTIIRFPVEPSPGTWGAEFRDAGFVEIPQELPEWLDNGDWRFKLYRWGRGGSEGIPQSNDRPGCFLKSYLARSIPFAARPGNQAYPYPGYPGKPIIRFVDTSTEEAYHFTDDRFGTLTGVVSGSTLNVSMTGWLADFISAEDTACDGELAFHYCKDPIPTFDGGTRYKKNLVVWTCRTGDEIPTSRYLTTSAAMGYWRANHLLIARIDYDPSVIDFDAEIVRGKLFVDE